MHKYKTEKVYYLSEGVNIAALKYTPEKEGRSPAIVMAHGFGLTKEAYIDKFAERFAENGFVVILFDYRNIGESEGFPRQEINPFMQIDDYKNSITFACTQAEVDIEKIGIWGTSFSGGHVLITAATDSRVRCVVSQVPTISGFQSGLRRMSAKKEHDHQENIKQDRLNRLQGREPMMKAIVGEASENPLYPMSDAEAYYEGAFKLSPTFHNEVTLRTTEYTRMYEPGIYVSRISPIPVLFVVALNDDVTPTDLAMEAYEEALQPKGLITIPGGHFMPYLQYFDIASNAAIDWFSKYLID